MGEVSFVKLASTTSWPPLEDGRISTKEFLEASRVILKFFDTLGKLYIPVRKDVEGNIIKLSSKYSEDPVKYAYIQDMIHHEISNSERLASESLLWLKRGLHFVYLFLHSLVVDHEKGVSRNCLLENIRISYEIALKPYHNWTLQQLFLMLSRAAPNRNNLFKSMTNNYAGNIDQDEMMTKVNSFTKGLKANLEVIFDLFVQLKLDTCQFLPLPTNN